MRDRLQSYVAAVCLWLRRLFHRGDAYYRIVCVAELPQQLRMSRLYVVGARSTPWSVALPCPCGCGERIHLSLLIGDYPRWTLTIDARGRPTLFPSVWRTVGCRSHFFLRRGRLHWCDGNGYRTLLD
jgi:hypothetical protein